MSLWEIIGTILGIVGVALMIRQNVWAWPVGLVQVAVYAWVFYDVKLYSDALLQLCFFALLLYGWIHWWRGAREASRSTRPVTRLPAPAAAGWFAVGAVATLAWGRLMAQTDAALPYWDASILMFSLVAQWLQARKVLECWLGWILVNTVAIGVYWAKDLQLTAALYVLFWAMAAWGWREWRKSLREVRA